MTTDTCRRGHIRTEENTYRNRNGKTICRECRRKRVTAFQHNHRALCTRWSVAWHRKRVVVAKHLVIQAKSKPCADCGKSYPSYVMDFDHGEGDKVGNVGSMKHRVSLTRLQEEIDKCEVVCANCHRERTHQLSLKNATVTITLP